MTSTFGNSFNAELAAYSSNTNNGSSAIMNIASQTVLGRNTSGVGPVEAMNATTTKYVLGLDNVENTALSTWIKMVNTDIVKNKIVLFFSKILSGVMFQTAMFNCMLSYGK